MVRLLLLLLLLVLLAFGAQRAVAQPQETPSSPSDAVKAMAGTWDFTNAGRDKVCTVRFHTDAASHGMKIEFDRSCAGLFAFLAEVTSWTIAENDFLRLIDAKGQPVLEFSEVESGVFEAPKQGEGILFIQKPVAAPASQRTAADLAGEWVVARENRTPLCSLTLTDAPAGDDMAVRVNRPCDAAVTRFGPATWQIDSDEMVLKSARGQAWRFEESEERVWRRVPATSSPILLLRK